MVVQDGIVYKGSQVVVAKSLRNDYLKLFHPSHMGSESTLRRARDAVYWPHMAEDIKRITFECRHCEEDAPAQTKEPQSAHMVPKHPWSKVGIDLCCYLVVIVDYLTDYISRFQNCSKLMQQLLSMPLSNTLWCSGSGAHRWWFPVYSKHSQRHGSLCTLRIIASQMGRWNLQLRLCSGCSNKVQTPTWLFWNGATPQLSGLTSHLVNDCYARQTRGAVPVSAWKSDPAPLQKMWAHCRRCGKRR